MSDIPPWHTSTVVGIIQGIRQSQDYSAMPILADALQDADFPDEKIYLYVHEEKRCSLLDVLRNPATNWIIGSRVLCLILRGEYMESLEWIDDFTMNLRKGAWKEENQKEMTYYFLMKAARQWIDNHDWTDQDGGMNWQNTLGDELEEFWKHFEVVTGIEVEQEDKTESFFSCSC